MKVIIAGSRTISSIACIVNAVDQSGFDITEVVSGMARGVDSLAIDFANLNIIPVHKFPADWNKYGKSAGYIRNQQMAEFADALIAIWDGQSKGTKHMIDIMQKTNKPAFIYQVYLNIPKTEIEEL